MKRHHASTDLAAGGAVVGQARHFTRSCLRRWGVADPDEIVVLLVSELVTNALIHAGSRISLTLAASGGRVRAEVRDGVPTPPVLRQFSESSSTGRGIRIVDSLARSWGYGADGEGKVVWFEVELSALRAGVTSAEASVIPGPAPDRESASRAGRPPARRVTARARGRFLPGRPAGCPA